MTTKENEQKQLRFPDINKVLCSNKTISLEEAMNKYRQMLLDTKLPYNILYANKILEHQELLSSKNLITFKRDISQLQKHLATWKRKKGYTFGITIQQRRKSDRKFHDKIRLFLTDMFINGKDITLDSILDMIGIRLILNLGNEDKLDHIKLCRDILIETINFFTIEKGYNPIKAEPKLFLGFDKSKHPEVVVAPKNLIPEEFRIYVKDYYSDPKENSYQSYHIVFKTKCGLPLEVQIRTFATDYRVEHEKAPHNKYDQNKYQNPIILDRKNINIYGYKCFYDVKTNTEQISDYVGLDESINPFTNIY